MTVSTRKTSPNLSYIFSQLFFIRMLDPGAGPAIFLTTGEHLPVKPGMKPSAQESQDILGREVDRGVVQQPRVNTSQRIAAGEDQISGVLSLVDDPIIIVAAKPSLFHQRVNLANQAIEDLSPVQMAEPNRPTFERLLDRPGP